MRTRTCGLLLTFLAASPSLAQGPSQAPGFDLALAQWRQDHGAGWRTLVDRQTGHLEMLYGANAPAPTVPDTNDESQWFALARHWIAETEGLHGISTAELVDERFTYLPLGMAEGTDKITVRLSQVIDGLDVEGAKVNALFDTQGRLLSLHSTAAPITDHLTTVPTISQATARRAAVDLFELDTSLPALDVGVAELLFAQVQIQGVREARLAYRVTVTNDREPAGYTYVIDAGSGLSLRRDEEVHYLDVKGVIKSMATPGLQADHAGNPPVDLIMPHIRVTSSAGTQTTNRDGEFNFVGVNTPLDVTVIYTGAFTTVNNTAGSNYTITFTGVPPNQANTLLMNPNPGQFRNAQANAFLHINTVRDYIRDTVPSDNTADFKITSNTNLNSSCNAFYNGSVNYYRKLGGCNNTAFSTIIAHEYGHGLNIRYGTGNGSDGMGEGNSDTFAMYTFDDHAIGRFFGTGGGFIRSGLNNRQYCGDGNGGCYGQVHADGEVWMGAAWKVRRNIKQNLGPALGRATADGLFIGWLNAYNQTTIHSVIEIQWLTLDDDDGNIDNGTPNYPQINNAFVQQGFPGFELQYLDFQNVTQLTDTPTESGPYTVNADILALLHPPVTNPTLHWRLNGGSFNPVAMTSTGGNGFTADIPPTPGTGIVQYYLSAQDSQNHTAEYPEGGQEAALEFTVGTPKIFASWDFEAAGDEGWVGGLSSDTATDGFWERDDPNPTAAQPGDDHTPGSGNVKCWLTGQHVPGTGLAADDVDKGKTTLRSPILDMDGFSGVRVSYWRWFSNNKGGDTNADVFRVRVSGDGGITWSLGERVGPSGQGTNGGWFQGQFVVDHVLTPTATMQIEFIAQDFDSASVIEAAVDDVVITVLEGGCAQPQNYCQTSPNSVGSGALISTFGSTNVLDGTFGLTISDCPPNQFGLVFFGPDQTFVPLADGWRCVGGSLSRLPILQTDVFGIANHLVDFSTKPGDTITNGSTWNFQFWYRDPSGGGAGSNFSDGVEVTFCD